MRHANDQRPNATDSDGNGSSSIGSRVIGRHVLRDEIRERLIEDILEGRLQAGSRLVETRLAREFGVSQAPVREALRDLEMLGFVVKSAFRGASVRRIAESELTEIYPIRAALEGVAAGAAATRMAESTLTRLEALLATMYSAGRRGDGRAQVEADIAFHCTVVEASGNGLLKQFWNAMRLATTTFLTVSMSHRSLVELAERHVPILTALRARDPAAAEAAMRQHIEEAGGWIRSAIEQAATPVDGARPKPELDRVGML